MGTLTDADYGPAATGQGLENWRPLPGAQWLSLSLLVTSLRAGACQE